MLSASFPRRSTCLPKAEGNVLILQKYLHFPVLLLNVTWEFIKEKKIKNPRTYTATGCVRVFYGSRAWMVLGAPNQCQAPENLNSSQDMHGLSQDNAWRNSVFQHHFPSEGEQWGSP